MAVSGKDQRKFARDFYRLLDMAKQSNGKLSDRYSYIAANMVKSKKLKLLKEEKFLICRRCNKLLVPGKNCTVRLVKGFLTYKCLNCGNVKKLKYDTRI